MEYDRKKRDFLKKNDFVVIMFVIYNMINNERNDMEITTDTHGIYMRDYQDTLVEDNFITDNGEYIENNNFRDNHL